MKKLIAIILVLASVAACKSVSKENQIIQKIGDKCKIKAATEKCPAGNLYIYENLGDSGYKYFVDVKGVIDVSMNALPNNTEKLLRDSDSVFYDSYKWETPTIEVNLYCFTRISQLKKAVKYDMRIVINSKE